MEHIKTVHEQTVQTAEGTPLWIRGPVTAGEVRALPFHPGLVAFRPPADQQTALAGIADLPEGRIIQASTAAEIIGYATFVYPHPLERWAEGKQADLIELGAIEVAPPYRGAGIGKKLLEIAFADDFMENYIVISTEYYWHWDLKGTGLSIWQYRDMMERIMGTVGMEAYATDDPDITAHPANCLMVRIGERVPAASVDRFDALRYKKRHIQ